MSDRYRKENAANRILGYYNPPSISDKEKLTALQKFEIAKSNALYFMRLDIQDVEKMTFSECFKKPENQPV